MFREKLYIIKPTLFDPADMGAEIEEIFSKGNVTVSKYVELFEKKCGLKIKYLRTFKGVYEFRKFHITSFAFWKTLAFWPLYAIGMLFNHGFYIEAYLTEE